MAETIQHALPSCSAEKRIVDLMHELNCSNTFGAALARINPTVLSNALRGIRQLENEIASELLETLNYLMEISENVRPFEIPLRNATEVRDLVWKLKKAGVTGETVREGISKITGGQS